MKKIYYIKCNKNGKFKNPKIYILDKILVLFIICFKRSSKDAKIFKGEESSKVFKILGLVGLPHLLKILKSPKIW